MYLDCYEEVRRLTKELVSIPGSPKVKPTAPGISMSTIWDWTTSSGIRSRPG